jgi:hypothetical protein
MRVYIKLVNFATSKSLIVKNTKFPHRNIRKYIWTSSDGKTQNQFEHVLIDERQYYNIVDVQSFRGASCATII